MEGEWKPRPLNEVIKETRDLKLWLAVGCAACQSFDPAEGCQDQHGLCLCFGQLHCKWQRKSREAFERFLAACNFSALQNELLPLYYTDGKEVIT